MKITFLTPGTGSYYCGACMRDNALANALIQAGHEAELLPMYLPLMLDEESEGLADDVPIFFGGINIFLQQKFSLFRHTPEWMDRLLNKPNLLRSAAKRSHMTSAREHGAMTFEMLELDSDRFRKELNKLYSWINDSGVPDVFILSTSLMAGFAQKIKSQWGVPVVCCFQGEDAFLDSLPDEYRERCWNLMAKRCEDADVLLAPSRSYANVMEDRLKLSSGTISVQPNGINLEGYSHRSDFPDTPVIGYLARMCEIKGLLLLVDAFIYLRKSLGQENCKLRIAGAMTAGDVALVDSLKAKLETENLSSDVEWLPNLPRDEKIAFLQSLSLFSVPVVYEEAFGLYILEAMAASVPVVQPHTSSFPEITEKTGGGLCVEINDATSLAKAWHGLLEDPDKIRRMGEQGRLGVEKFYSLQAMSSQFINVVDSLVRSPAS